MDHFNPTLIFSTKSCICPHFKGDDDDEGDDEGDDDGDDDDDYSLNSTNLNDDDDEGDDDDD